MSRFRSSRPRRLERLMGPLRRRFVVLLLLLAAMSVVPWYVSVRAGRTLEGFGHRIDLAGSLRYRLRELELHLAHPDLRLARAKKARVEHLVTEQGDTLTRLIQGDAAARIPPCRDPALCARLAGHLSLWRFELAPAVVAATREPGDRAAILQRLDNEFRRLDDTVHHVAKSAEQAVMDWAAVGRLAALGALVLLALIGLGVWQVFARIRRLDIVVRTALDEQDLAALGRGGDEVASLARNFAANVRALRLRGDETRRQKDKLGTQQRAMRALAQHVRFASSLAALGDLEEHAPRIGEKLGHVLAYETALLVIFDETGPRGWHFARGAHLVSMRVFQLPPLPDGEEITRLDRETRAACAAPNGEAVTAALSLPLHVGGKRIGLLIVGRTSGDFTDPDLEVARRLAPLLATAVKRMQLEADARLAQQLAVMGAFSAMLAHETRNPLNAMGLQLTLLRRRLRQRTEGAAGDRAVADAITKLEAELGRLESLVKDYQALAPHQGLDRFEPADLRDIVSEAVAAARGALDQLQIELELDLGKYPVVALVDRRRIQRLMAHLLENAIEALAQSPRRRLAVRTRRQGDAWEIAVQDSGPGVTDSARIFAPSYSTKPAASGMGLPVSLQIAHLHRGSLTARPGDGGGAEFVLTLPAHGDGTSLGEGGAPPPGLDARGGPADDREAQ